MDCGFYTKDEPGHKIVCKSGIFFSIGPEQVAAPLTALLLLGQTNARPAIRCVCN
jgi:hypothetical protein